MSKEEQQKSKEQVVITITLTEEGAVTTKVESKEQVEINQIVGLMEVSKNDILNNQDQQQDQQQEETIDVTLDKLDFEMDTMNSLTKREHKVGSTIPIPKSLVRLRDRAREEFQLNKQREEDQQDATSK